MRRTAEGEDRRSSRARGKPFQADGRLSSAVPALASGGGTWHGLRESAAGMRGFGAERWKDGGMKLLQILAAGLAVFSGLPLGPADAADGRLTTRYNVSLIGLPVGRASFNTTISGRTYSVEGELTSAGLADIISTTKGTSRVEGNIRGDRLYASRYRLNYSTDRKTYSSDVSFKSGRVVSASVAPEVTRPKADYVPVKKQQLTTVVDPLGGLMIKGKATPESICGRTLPFFDGWSRLDLVLSPAGTRPFETDGYSGDVIVCDVRITPVSGYRASSKGVKFIQRQTLQFWFAPIGDSGIFAPVYARIPTEIGPLTLKASIFAKE